MMNDFLYNTIEWSLLQSYITYDRLYGLTKHILYNTDQCRFVDIYIDMHSLINHIFYTKYNINNYSCLTSSMINLATHLKQFYRSRFGINSRIFIVYSDNFPERPRKLLPEYNQRNYTTYVNNGQLVDLIGYNCDILRTICPYLDEIYFIQEKNQETAIVIKDIIRKQIDFRKSAASRYPNIIITKDLYSYQLVSSENDTFILRPRKHEGEDKSWCVTKNNIYKAIKKELGGNLDIHQLEYPISSSFLPIILSIIGLKTRNIKAIHTYNKTLDIINDSINKNLLVNDTNSDIEFVFNQLSQLSNKISENKELLISRFYALDFSYNQNLYRKSLSNSSNIIGIIDLEDPITVQEINNTYFQNNPLDLMNI